MLRSLGIDCEISNRVEDISRASHLVLPGVGAFGNAMQQIDAKLPVDFLTKTVIEEGKPFLGICVGMQVLATTGHEFGENRGLGWIPGKVEKLDSRSLPLPHIGWNNIALRRPSKITEGLPNDLDYYFVHSFAFSTEDPSDVVATCDYGTSFPAIVNRKNIFGVQFHPEKSQDAGKLLLNNFFGKS